MKFCLNSNVSNLAINELGLSYYRFMRLITNPLKIGNWKPRALVHQSCCE